AGGAPCAPGPRGRTRSTECRIGHAPPPPYRRSGTESCRCPFEEPARRADLAGVEGRREQHDEAPDAGTLERLSRARVCAQHALVEPRERRHQEPRRVAARGGVLVARALDERAELRMKGLRVEAVRVPAGDGGHPWPEA